MTDKTVSQAIERGIYFLFANRRFCGNERRGYANVILSTAA